MIRSKRLLTSIWLPPKLAEFSGGAVDRFTATLVNHGAQTLTDCKALLIDPVNEIYNRYDHKFYYCTCVRNTFDFNKGVEFAPGESKKVILALTPRELMNSEVKFEFVCSNDVPVLSIPLVNTVQLASKLFPLSPEDNTRLSNSKNKSVLEIDLGSGKYWSLYALKVSNTGTQSSIVNQNSLTDLAQIERSTMCEVVGNGNWQYITPRAEH